MAMNRSGRSLPAGPAITPQASSGWSARTWATILSYSEREMVSMIDELTRVLVHGLNEGFLDGAEPGVHLERAPLRVVRLEPAPLLLELLGHAEPDAEREPDVVQRLEPGQGLVLSQLDAAAVLRRRVRPRPVHHRLQRGQLGVLARFGALGAWTIGRSLRLDQGHDLADQAAQQGRLGRGEPGARAAAADRPEWFHKGWLLVLLHRGPQAIA